MPLQHTSQLRGNHGSNLGLRQHSASSANPSTQPSYVVKHHLDSGSLSLMSDTTSDLLRKAVVSKHSILGMLAQWSRCGVLRGNRFQTRFQHPGARPVMKHTFIMHRTQIHVSGSFGTQEATTQNSPVCHHTSPLQINPLWQSLLNTSKKTDQLAYQTPRRMDAYGLWRPQKVHSCRRIPSSIALSL